MSGWFDSEIDKLVSSINSQTPTEDDWMDWRFWNIEGSAMVLDSPGETILEYTDAGVGEDYILQKCNVLFPGTTVEVEGGCDSCGYGRTVTLNIPWIKEEILRKCTP